jgi:hypothetical protein
MSEKSMSDLQPGDYFIQKVFVDDLVVHLYGHFEHLTPEGLFAGQMNHNSGVTLDGRVLSQAQHELVGVISESAYRYAARHGWPNDAEGVAGVLSYSSRPRGVGALLVRLFQR